jgi:hypothetical protein
MDNYQLKQSFQVIDSENGMIPYVIHRDEAFIVLKTADNPDPLYLHIKAAVLIAEAINQLAKIKP